MLANSYVPVALLAGAVKINPDFVESNTVFVFVPLKTDESVSSLSVAIIFESLKLTGIYAIFSGVSKLKCPCPSSNFIK